MKIAVYAIAKNEEHHVQRFMASIKNEADAVYVLDTGSTDSTVELLRKEGATVETKIIDPWRFDVARNESLALVPDSFDVCVCIDLDEVLTPGWRKAVEECWTPKTTNLHYNYIWSHSADGAPAVSFWISKIHARKNFEWIYPVHEIINYTAGEPAVTKCDKLEVHHYQDRSKDRKSYLPLLELAVKEHPDNDRNSHYLAREYLMFGKLEEAIAEFKRHLTLPSAVWDVERAASMRYLARCHTRLKKFHEARQWALRACAEAPFEREPWWELSIVAHEMRDFNTLYFAAVSALSNGKQGERYIADATAWGFGPYDYAAVAAHSIGLPNEALKYGQLALEIAQKHNQKQETIERLQKNLLAFKMKANVEKAAAELDAKKNIASQS